MFLVWYTMCYSFVVCSAIDLDYIISKGQYLLTEQVGMQQECNQLQGN